MHLTCRQIGQVNKPLWLHKKEPQHFILGDKLKADMIKTDCFTEAENVANILTVDRDSR